MSQFKMLFFSMIHRNVDHVVIAKIVENTLSAWHNVR